MIVDWRERAKKREKSGRERERGRRERHEGVKGIRGEAGNKEG